MAVLKMSPLKEFHREMDAKMVPVSGWSVPWHYPGGIAAEHRNTREHGAFFDTSHEGRLRISGKGTFAALDGMLPRSIADLAVGGTRAELLLTDRGGVIDRITLLRMAEEDFFCLVAPGNGSSVRSRIASLAPKSVEITDLTEVLAQLEVHGPGAVSALVALGAAEEDLPAPGTWKILELDALRCIVSGTSEAGGRGFRLCFDGEHADELWDLLLETEPLYPAGAGTLEALRMEAGTLQFGKELLPDELVPQNGFPGGVRPDLMREFPGCVALRTAEKRSIVAGIRFGGRQVLRSGTPVRDASGSELGRITTCALLPGVNHAAALFVTLPGVVPAAGTAVLAGEDAAPLPGEVAELTSCFR